MGPPRPVHFVGEGVAISRCSIRHAAILWLTNKDGKQEAKDDDDKREWAEHLERLPIHRGSVKWFGRTVVQFLGRLDEFTGVHNNSVMNFARLTPVVVLANLVRSMGAAG